jgi:hypothetical protein
MIRFALMVCTVAVLATTATTASAHNPERIAARCLEEVRGLVDRCTNAAAHETKECVRKINALQEQGRDEAAIRVARECVESARHRTRRCISEIRDVCTRCIDFLLDIGEEDLAARVRWNCGDAIEDVENVLAREVSAIQAALAD